MDKDDFESDFEDVMQPKPPKAAQQERSERLVIHPALDAFCKRYGLTIRHPHETHYQVMQGDKPLLDFWPDTNRYRFNRAPAGSKARVGGQGQILSDLQQWIDKQAREKNVKQPSREQVFADSGPAEPFMSSQAVRPLARAIAQEVSAELRPLLREARGAEVIDQQRNGQPHSLPLSLAGEDDFVVTYWVALHALIIRAEDCRPETISQHAAAFAYQAMRHLGEDDDE